MGGSLMVAPRHGTVRARPEYVTLGGFSVVWLAPVLVGLVIAGLGAIIALKVPSFSYRVVAFIAVACGSALVGLAIWPTLTVARVYLSHAVGPGDSVTLLRLKDLASANGIKVENPRRELFRLDLPAQGLPHGIRAAIDRSDFVLALITAPVDLAAERELAYAEARNKLIVPIVGLLVEHRSHFGRFPRLIRPLPDQSDEQMQAEITMFLRRYRVGRRLEKTVRQLVGISLGLLSEPR